MNRDELTDAVDSVKTWYHTIDLGQGVVTPGAYDLRGNLAVFQFPDLSGRAVLDVGVSNGFFAFHFEKLGARRVVGTELASIRDHDFPDWYREVVERKLADPDHLIEVERNTMHGGFTIAKKALGSSVEREFVRIYDLPGHFQERFDFAFCGSVLIHLRDPVAGLEAIRKVLHPGGELVVSTSIDAVHPTESYARFVGRPDICGWWVFSPKALIDACKMAGFATATYIGDHDQNATMEPFAQQRIGIVHCQAPT